MNHRLFSLSAGIALALAATSPAQAGVPVIDLANLVPNTVTAVATTATAIKMHYVIDRLDYMSTKDDGHYDEQNYYDVLNQDHNNLVNNYNEVNNYYCGTDEGEGGEGGGGVLGAEGGGQVCNNAGLPGEIIIDPPALYGAGSFGGRANAQTYMTETKQMLGDVVGNDSERFTSVMDGNTAQAQAVDSQVQAFAMEGATLSTLAKQSTGNHGARMQAAYANQIAVAQTGEMMKMRALVLAEQTAQVVREQEAAARGARESIAESNLRAKPALNAASIKSW